MWKATGNWRIGRPDPYAGRPRRDAARRRLRGELLGVQRLESRLPLASDLAFESAFQFGDIFSDEARVVKSDSSGNVYVAGKMGGTVDFDPGPGVVSKSGSLYVAKYSAAGLLWARTLDGEFGYFGGDMVVDPSGAIYLTESFRGSVDFDPGSGTFSVNAGTTKDGFVLKLTSAGDFGWVKTFGGTGDVDSYGIERDSSGNLFAVGTFGGTVDLDPGAGTYSATSMGDLDAWAMSLGSGGAFRWGAATGGPGEDRGVDVGLDNLGDVYVIGDFTGTADFDPGAGTLSMTSNGYEDVFYWKLSNAGSVVWAKQVGGPATERAGGLFVDPTGNFYTTGYFWGDVDFDPNAGSYPLTPVGGNDAFVSKLNSAGIMGWAQKLGGGANDQGIAIASDGAGSVFVTGAFQGTADFNPGAGVANLTSAGGDDIFIARLTDASGAYAWAGRMGGAGNDYPFAILGSPDLSLFVTGSFQGTADFDPGAAAFDLVSAGEDDAFIAILSYASSAPGVTIEQAIGQVDPTAGSPIRFTVVFSETVFGFDSSDITLSGPGSLVAVVTPSGSGTNFNVEVTGMAVEGDVVASIAADVAIDDEGNLNRASTSVDNRVAFDGLGPSVRLADPSSGGSIPFDLLNARRTIDVTFVDAVSGLEPTSVTDPGDEFTLVGEAAAGVTLAGAGVLVAGNTYRYSFVGDFSPGVVSIRSIAGGFADRLGNLSTAIDSGAFIVDDLPLLSINAPSVTEPNSGTVNLTFVVTLSYPSQSAVSVSYSTADGTAVAGADYTAKVGTLTFAPGVTSQSVIVAVRGDLFDEANETVLLTLFSAVNAKLPAQPGVGTILDNDPAVTITVGDLTVAEGGGSATFTVRLSSASGQTVEAVYETHVITAAADADYVPMSGTLIFAPGELSKAVTVTILQDVLDEPSEQFELHLSGLVNAQFGDALGIATITDDDPIPTLGISDGEVLEGDSGTTAATFTITLSAASGQPVTVRYATANGSATGGPDYVPQPLTTLTFAPGEVAKQIIVPVKGDLVDEDDETFTINLSSPVNATLSTTRATGTIRDDDLPPRVSVTGTAIIEGDSGSAAAVVVVGLSAASSRTVSVKYATRNGSATAGDYVSKSGTLTFAPGTTELSVPISIVGDLAIEGNEAFFVDLTQPVNAGITVPSAEVQIIDNDPSARISGVTVSESGIATFNVTVSILGSSAIVIDYQTVGDTAVAGEDFVNTTGQLVFSPGGPLTKSIAVPLINDLIDENDETFSVCISGVRIENPCAVGKITDNDLPPTITITNSGAQESTGGADFQVTLARPSGKTVTVKYATSAVTATSGVDFVARSGTLTFNPGETVQVVSVDVLDDPTDEFDTESFKTTLSYPTNATIASGTSTSNAAIEDDDLPPEMSIDDVQVVEGDSYVNTMRFTVNLSAASGKMITVAFATASDTAVSGKDFRPVTGTLTFSPGVTTRFIDVPIIGELIDEPDVETFSVKLASVTNANLIDGTGIGTIQDNDLPPFLTINTASATEDNIDGDSGFVATFYVSLSRASEREVRVDYHTELGTAVDGEDYVDKSGTLVFAPGVTRQAITVQYIGDTLDEINESYTVHLSLPVNATIQGGIGTGTIVDNDMPPVISIGNAEETVTEGETLDFPIELSEASGRVINVGLVFSGVSPNAATAGSDYETRLSIQIPARITKVLLDVDTLNDTLFENTESFRVRITSLDAAVDPAHASGVGTILDNDPKPQLTINEVNTVEGNSGTKNLVFTVSKWYPSSLPVTVKYLTQPFPPSSGVDTAAAGEDYYAKSGTLTFPASTQMSQTQSLTVQVRGDLKVEKDEWFLVELYGETNATVTAGLGRGTIINDDPTLSVSDVTVTEGDTQSVTARFTVRLSAPSNLPVSIDYQTRDDSAIDGVDYLGGSGTLTFAPGQTTQTVDITIPGDRYDEPNRVFYLDLSNPTNAFLTGGGDTLSAKGTINDNDAAPSIRIDGPYSVTEGDDGSVQQTFQLTLSAESAWPVSVQVKTTNGTASVADNDYEAIAPYRVEFAPRTPGSPGETTKWVTVNVFGDAKPEANETLFVDLASPTNATLGNTRGTLTIVDDDNRTLSIDDVSVQEGNSGPTTAAFTVTLSRPSSQQVSVNVYTQNGTATSPSDYAAVPLTTIVFPPGETQLIVGVTVNGDTTKEGDETFYVKLASPVNATIADGTGVGTIRNDDIGAWQISVTLVGSGSVYDVNYPTKIDTRVGRYLATYGSNDFPSLQAVDGSGNLAHAASWYNAVTMQLLGLGTGLVLTPNSFEDGLPIKVYLQGGPLRANPDFVPVPGGAADVVDSGGLEMITDAAIAAWVASGFSPLEEARLRGVRFAIDDLPGSRLGFASGDWVVIDRDAGGFGWFIDPTPDDDVEFVRATDGILAAAEGTSADDRMDLLTAVMHELGHVLGLEDLEADHKALMSATLAPGIRKVR